MKKLFVLGLCLGLVGCITTSSGVPTQEDRYAPTFSYTPPVQATPASNDVTFTVASAICKPSGALDWSTFPQFAGLSGAIQQDLQRILTAKGFDVRGPYDSYDLVPFQDKGAIDLFALATVQFTVTLKDLKEQREDYRGWQSPTDQTGTVDVSGKVTIELKEITTRELMWTKTIPIKDFTFPYLARIPWGQPYKRDAPYSYDPIINGMAKGLERQYPAIMATVYGLIDPQDMRIIKKQAGELKDKEG